MATTPLWTETDLLEVTRAIASGALEVRFSDRTITYRSIDDLIKAKNVIESYLSTSAGDVPIRQVRIFTDGGW